MLSEMRPVICCAVSLVFEMYFDFRGSFICEMSLVKLGLRVLVSLCGSEMISFQL
jgi:hypothetical protein